MNSFEASTDQLVCSRRAKSLTIKRDLILFKREQKLPSSCLCSLSFALISIIFPRMYTILQSCCSFDCPIVASPVCCTCGSAVRGLHSLMTPYVPAVRCNALQMHCALKCTRKSAYAAVDPSMTAHVTCWPMHGPARPGQIEFDRAKLTGLLNSVNMTGRFGAGRSRDLRKHLFFGAILKS